ncbi:hypothetical protein [Pseudarthrobacter sp. PH31-O2]|uniref:hypothetical protein n=1 Tax=Pseudarthrobacter sp. PH31-O2 TaxID=3046206 RepID=UPI0024B9E731|nr:hypothetical protein [Pseudarthrobacter sp. PH31-O2]MDJ0354426.1 hypothetical protein [Pseudarthrobacter sp. PH31-O2]
MAEIETPATRQREVLEELSVVGLAEFVQLFEVTLGERALEDAHAAPSARDAVFEVPKPGREDLGRFSATYAALRDRLLTAQSLKLAAEGHGRLSSHSKLLQAAINMERSVEALGPVLAAVDEEVSPQLARSLQATENAWRKMEAEFGLLSSKEVSEAVGSKSPNRSFASDQRAAGKLLAVKRPGGFRYPGFQIDRSEHTIRPVIHDLLKVAQEADRSETSLALWMVSPTGYLDGARPVDELDHPEQVVETARQSFNVQW